MLKVLPDDGNNAVIKVSDLGEAERSEWWRAREYLKQQLNKYVHLIPLDQLPEGATLAPVTEAVLATPAGKFEGGTRGSRGLPRFVGIVWDSRVMGECSAQPSIRMPPLHLPEVPKLFEAIRHRHQITSAPGGSPVLNQFDLYISITGGRALGAAYQKWFQQMGPPAAVTRQVRIFVDPLSIQDRYARVRGVASNRTHASMRLTAAPWPMKELKTTRRIHYRGTSASDSLGPVALTAIDHEDTWVLTWAEKKLVYGNHLIQVGGRGDIVDDGPDEDEADDTATTRRTDDTREIAFYHAYPKEFWDEVIHDYQLGAVIDLAAGDGTFALQAVRNRIPYTGFVFTSHHKEMLMARLLDRLSAGALKAGDKWYDPTLVKALLKANKAKQAQGEDGEPPKKKAKMMKATAKKKDGDEAQDKGKAKEEDTKKDKEKKKKKTNGTATKQSQGKAKKSDDAESDGGGSNMSDMGSDDEEAEESEGGGWD